MVDLSLLGRIDRSDDIQRFIEKNALSLYNVMDSCAIELREGESVGGELGCISADGGPSQATCTAG